MTANMFSLLVILGGLCGVFMVVGGLFLFYKGIITLQQVSDKPDAVTFEFQRVLKIQSRYPAYGFFIFGLAFLGLAFVYGRPPPELRTITLSGTVENVVDPSAARIRVVLPLWADQLNNDGRFQHDLLLDLKQVQIEIESPGNEPSPYRADVITSEQGHERVARLGAPIKLRKVGDQPPPATIEPLPADVKLAPITQAVGFRDVQ
jgi:hypothetical protein